MNAEEVKSIEVRRAIVWVENYASPEIYKQIRNLMEHAKETILLPSNEPSRAEIAKLVLLECVRQENSVVHGFGNVVDNNQNAVKEAFRIADLFLAELQKGKEV